MNTSRLLRSIDRFDAERRVLVWREQALRRAWAGFGTREMFTVASASWFFPEIANKFKAVLEWLRSPEFAALRNAEPVKASGNFDCVFAAVHHSEYVSQGYGAEKYARCRAYLFGLTVPDELPWKLVDNDVEGSIEARVCCDPKDLNRALGRSLPLATRNVVKACWKLGCQPRVFLPTLDPDFEKKNGLDFFGNDVTVSA
jgi:hypothetical protein